MLYWIYLKLIIGKDITLTDAFLLMLRLMPEKFYNRTQIM
jgi:hypothetical protein